MLPRQAHRRTAPPPLPAIRGCRGSEGGGPPWPEETAGTLPAVWWSAVVIGAVWGRALRPSLPEPAPGELACPWIAGDGEWQRGKGRGEEEGLPPEVARGATATTAPRPPRLTMPPPPGSQGRGFASGFRGMRVLRYRLRRACAPPPPTGRPRVWLHLPALEASTVVTVLLRP